MSKIIKCMTMACAMSDDGNWQMNAILAIYKLGFWKAAAKQHVCNHRSAKAACHLQLINSPLQSTNCCSGTGGSCLNRCLGSCKAWRFIRQPGFRVPCGIIYAATRGCGRWWCSCPWETAFSTGMGAVTQFLADCSGKRSLPGTLVSELPAERRGYHTRALGEVLQVINKHIDIWQILRC